MDGRQQPFKEYYLRWIRTLARQLLPNLKYAMQGSSRYHLHAHVERVRHHFESYYDALDRTARQDVLQVLAPPWRNALEKPYLWIGDWHPALFIHLFHGLLGDHGSRRVPSQEVLNRIKNMESVLRTMVPALFHRMRLLQLSLASSVARDWLLLQSRRETSVSARDTVRMFRDGVDGQVRQLTEIFLDANRLRKNIVTELLNACDVYQEAQYLRGLAQFQISLRDPDLFRAIRR